MRWFVSLLFVAACTTEAEVDEICDEMCQELVMTCEYDAYPSFESCMQGCAFSREQGGNVKRYQECVTEAACDTFLIVDCEHEFGAAAAEEQGKED